MGELTEAEREMVVEAEREMVVEAVSSMRGALTGSGTRTARVAKTEEDRLRDLLGRAGRQIGFLRSRTLSGEKLSPEQVAEALDLAREAGEAARG